MICMSLTERPLADYDICVVGSGPAGLIFALEAARLGKRVLVLESGSAGPDAEQQSLSTADITDPARHDDMAIAVARRLGGTSNLWAGRCQPFDPIDFEPRPGLRDACWPVGYSEIRPYYPAAIDYLCAGADVFRAPVKDIAVDDDAFDYTRLERFANVPAVQKRHAAELERSELIDLRLESTVVEIDLKVTGGGTIRNLIVADRQGKRYKIPVKAVVLACGGLETTRQLLVLQQKHTALFGGLDGPLGRYYMGHLVGEVADVTFTSEAADAAYDFFIDGNGSYVRRRLIPSDELQRRHELLNLCFWPVVPPVAEPRHRSGILSAVCLTFAIGPLGRFFVAEALRKRHIPEKLPWGAHIFNILRDMPSTLSFIPRFLHKRYFAEPRIPGFFLRNSGRRYGLSYHAEQSPQPDSRVTLSSSTDRFGVPKLSIDYRFCRADAESIFRAHRLLAEWLHRNGIGTIEYRQPESETVEAIMALAGHGTHQISLARMAETEDEGVVDRNLRCFGTDNLYVASAAIFPTSGQCNPTLSIAAFSVRLAHHLFGPQQNA